MARLATSYWRVEPDDLDRPQARTPELYAGDDTMRSDLAEPPGYLSYEWAPELDTENFPAPKAYNPPTPYPGRVQGVVDALYVLGKLLGIVAKRGAKAVGRFVIKALEAYGRTIYPVPYDDDRR